MRSKNFYNLKKKKKLNFRDSKFRDLIFINILKLYSNIRLEEYIFVYIYLIRLILKKVRKEEENRLLKLIY